MIMKRGDKLSCLQELECRSFDLNYIHDFLIEGLAVLHYMAHGKALVVYDDSDESGWIVIKDKRLWEQKKDVYKKLDCLEQNYFAMHHYFEEVLDDIEAHMQFVDDVRESVVEGSAVKEFVARGKLKNYYEELFEEDG